MENAGVLVPGTSLVLEQVVRESMETAKLLAPGTSSGGEHGKFKLLVPGTSNKGEHGNSEVTCSWNKFVCSWNKQ